MVVKSYEVNRPFYRDEPFPGYLDAYFDSGV